MSELKQAVEKFVNYPAASENLEQAAKRSRLSLVLAFGAAAGGSLFLGPVGAILGAVAGWKAAHVLVKNNTKTAESELLNKVADYPAAPQTLADAHKREKYELGGIFAGAVLGGALLGPVGVVAGVPVGMKAAHYLSNRQPG